MSRLLFSKEILLRRSTTDGAPLHGSNDGGHIQGPSKHNRVRDRFDAAQVDGSRTLGLCIDGARAAFAIALILCFVGLAHDAAGLVMLLLLVTMAEEAGEMN
jgi:hypothetical protein